MMTIGDFFASATHSRPVNPKPVKFTAVAKAGKILPGGTQNPTGGQRIASCEGALVFLLDGIQKARLDARATLQKRKDETGLPVAFDETDFNIEMSYQMFYLAVHQWDEKNRATGERLFPSVENVRELVEASEVGRVLDVYNAYVKEEHPEAVNPATF